MTGRSRPISSLPAPASDLQIQLQAAELKIRAERRAGSLLAGLGLHGGDHKSSRRGKRITLESLGIDSNQSARWQLEAALPDAVFERYVAAARAVNKRRHGERNAAIAKEFDGAARQGKTSSTAGAGKACEGQGIEAPRWPDSHQRVSGRIRFAPVSHPVTLSSIWSANVYGLAGWSTWGGNSAHTGIHEEAKKWEAYCQAGPIQWNPKALRLPYLSFYGPRLIGFGNCQRLTVV